jgi:hypothetical protein
VEQLRADINPSIVNGLTQAELSIWATPEGTTFVDGMACHYISQLHLD